MSLENPQQINPILAKNQEELESLQINGADPIIFRPNEYEVFVYTKNEKVESNIKIGLNWNTYLSGENNKHGYTKWIFTRLNEAQLMEHLVDPNKFQGED